MTATSNLFADVDKKYFIKQPYRFKECSVLEREVEAYKLLNYMEIPWCPKLIYHNESLIILENVGEEINTENIPFDYLSQIEKILADMEKIGMKQNDICKARGNCEILVKDGKLYLTDYGWATLKGDYSWGDSKISAKAKPYGIIEDKIIVGHLKKMYEKKKESETFFYFIINHNRLDVLRQQISSLEYHKEDIQKLVIVDHNSSYEPLLQYYETLKDNDWIDIVFKRDQYYKSVNEANANLARVGYNHMADTIKEYHKKYDFEYYGKCDPDCAIPAVPNYFGHLMRISKHFDNKYQVGGALRIDDIPDEYQMKQQNLESQARFRTEDLENNVTIKGEEYQLFMPVAIDGTMSIYHKSFLPSFTGFFCYSNYFPAIRVGNEFQIRHLDWYITKANEELINYRKTSGTKASHSINWILGINELNCDSEELLEKLNDL
jgi:hypothetical protein